ncbi:Dirigent protein [Quillaja saponaria]|uniref:Dirigent protein n=1 Tax=Quillaja saponaria TaxID=32244 RepID=A0AAD7VL79_QUISA|nr:Dirigent protein [Quillaja saponaria]
MKMSMSVILVFALILYTATTTVYGEYYSKSVPKFEMKEKVTKLHFYYFDTHSGKSPTAMVVAHPNITDETKPAGQFGTVYAIDNALRVGPELTSKLIGNARGLYVSSSLDDKVTLVMYVDYGFTSGKFNGSSISIFSRNPIAEPTPELAVVGGRGKFRMARGFAKIKRHFLDAKTGDGIIEYNVTLYHY